ncbi:DUF1349 domain-containing protein [Jeotgalibacillus aurantiacus]|uniref:DUF1349 domain-containing protein n=1 Tax=Jeotgalibacillus aurantiacus TaxID=2763266 RepID=UPI001D0B9A9E|nr:DUF1349 domain-containing protein [Jeotgalibacillus aurantiacus]
MHSLLENQAKDCCWLNEPPDYALEDKELIVKTKEKTDFWRKTHYGFDRMDGHVFYKEIIGAFETEAVFTMKDPKSRYDQAGLFIMVSDDCWLKASLEYIPEKHSFLGAVVTNNGFSDWSSCNVPTPENGIKLAFKISREGGNYRIWSKPAEGDHEYQQLRIARLHEDDHNGKVKLGLYACSPSPGGGFTTVFHSWTVQLEVK